MDYSAANSGLWKFVIELGLIAAAILAAHYLCRKIKFIQKTMMPMAVLAGFLLLAAKYLGLPLDEELLETLVFHGIGLGFIAMSLRMPPKGERSGGLTGLKSGAVIVSTYLVQGIVGLLISLLLSYTLMPELFKAAGILLPMGYGQGPGQAYNWGHNYEVGWGFANGTSFGLTVAAMGFVSASVGGVLHLNWLRRKGLYHGDLGRDAQDDLSVATFTDSDEIPLSESLDKFTVQLALVFLAYAMAYLFMSTLNRFLDPAGTGAKGIAGTLQGMIWGFQFLFGTVFGLLIKGVLGGLKKKGVIRREYTNNFMQNRIAGFMFDLMVVASIAAIDLSAFSKSEFIVPLSIICVAGAAVTYAYLRFLCPRVFPNYPHEAFLSLYGMQTGTASTGVILLREMDPNFETQASDNIVYHQPWAIVFGFPMLLLLPVAAQSITKGWITLGILIVLFAVMQLIVFRKSIFKKKKT